MIAKKTVLFYETTTREIRASGATWIFYLTICVPLWECADQPADAILDVTAYAIKRRSESGREVELEHTRRILPGTCLSEWVRAAVKAADEAIAHYAQDSVVATRIEAAE